MVSCLRHGFTEAQAGCDDWGKQAAKNTYKGVYQGGVPGGVYQGGVPGGWKRGSQKRGKRERAGAGESRELPRTDEWVVAAVSLVPFMREGQIDARNGHGLTPLMLACAHGSPGKQNSPNFLTFPELVSQIF